LDFSEVIVIRNVHRDTAKSYAYDIVEPCGFVINPRMLYRAKAELDGESPPERYRLSLEALGDDALETYHLPF